MRDLTVDEVDSVSGGFPLVPVVVITIIIILATSTPAYGS